MKQLGAILKFFEFFFSGNNSQHKFIRCKQQVKCERSICCCVCSFEQTFAARFLSFSLFHTNAYLTIFVFSGRPNTATNELRIPYFATNTCVQCTQMYVQKQKEENFSTSNEMTLKNGMNCVLCMFAQVIFYSIIIFLLVYAHSLEQT